MARKDELIVGLDIGTTKICAVVGEVSPTGIDIVGIGSAPSNGMRRGVVVDVENTVQSIVQAIEEAETMAGCEIRNVYTGVAGGHIKGLNSSGAVGVKGSEIVQDDVDRAFETAKAIHIPPDREVIHIIPQEYIVDDQDGILNPIGMNGIRLECRVHIVTASVTGIQNIGKCCNRAGLNVAEFVLQPLASAKAVLTEDEKKLGVALVDIGGGTSDIIIYHEGSIVHTSIIGFGGNHITNDLAHGLRTPFQDAEQIKQKYGCALTQLVNKEENVTVPSVGDRKARTLPRQVLAELIEPRAIEIFQFILGEVEKSGYEDLLAAGVVITGGSVIMDGMAELAEETLGMPVRRGMPRGVGGLVSVVRSPIYSTGVGLVSYGYERQDERKQSEGMFRAIRKRLKGIWAELT
ncbi:MAG: cell division protein FtsA [Myxococcota bacterium]